MDGEVRADEMKPYKNGSQKWALGVWIQEIKKRLKNPLWTPPKRLISPKRTSKKKDSNGKVNP